MSSSTASSSSSSSTATTTSSCSPFFHAGTRTFRTRQIKKSPSLNIRPLSQPYSLTLTGSPISALNLPLLGNHFPQAQHPPFELQTAPPHLKNQKINANDADPQDEFLTSFQRNFSPPQPSSCEVEKWQSPSLDETTQSIGGKYDDDAVLLRLLAVVILGIAMIGIATLLIVGAGVVTMGVGTVAVVIVRASEKGKERGWKGKKVAGESR